MDGTATNSLSRLSAIAVEHKCTLWFLNSTITVTHKLTLPKSSEGGENERTQTLTRSSTDGVGDHVLDLSHLRVTELSIPSPALPKLASMLLDLQLQGNLLKTLPMEIFRLSHLKELNLGYNSLSSIPPEIEGLRDLREFLLHGNRIPNLPQEIGNLLKLKMLDVSGNQLRELPAELGYLKGLKQVYVDDNFFNVNRGRRGRTEGSGSGHEARAVDGDDATMGEMVGIGGDATESDDVSLMPSDDRGEADLGGHRRVSSGDVEVRRTISLILDRMQGINFESQDQSTILPPPPLQPLSTSSTSVPTSSTPSSLQSSTLPPSFSQSPRSPFSASDLESSRPPSSESLLENVQSLTDMTVQMTALILAKDNHAYCPKNSCCFSTRQPADVDISLNKMSEEVERSEGKKGVAADDTNVLSSPPSTNSSCVLQLLPSSISRKILPDRTSRPPACFTCRRRIYCTALVVRGLMLLCGTKVVPVVYHFCSHRCRGATKR